MSLGTVTIFEDQKAAPGAIDMVLGQPPLTAGTDPWGDGDPWWGGGGTTDGWMTDSEIRDSSPTRQPLSMAVGPDNKSTNHTMEALMELEAWTLSGTSPRSW